MSSASFLPFMSPLPCLLSSPLSVGDPKWPQMRAAPAAGRRAHELMLPTILAGDEPARQRGETNNSGRQSSGRLECRPPGESLRELDVPPFQGWELDQALRRRVAGALEEAPLCAGAGVGA